MEQEEWFDRFSHLIDGTVESLYEDTDNITGADVGLILTITEEYLEDPDNNMGRCLRTLELSQTVLDVKYNVKDISWFDIYEIVVGINSEVRDSFNSEGEDLDGELNELYSEIDGESEHTEEFHTCTQRLFEAVTSNEAEELQEADPYGDLETSEFDHFKYGISNKVGFQRGSVEIPNNASRMTASNKVLDHIRDLNDDDLEWIIRTLKQWIKMYARAEATVTNRNVSQDELRMFMNGEQTPAEKYWQ